ncbi:TPA: response regulator transcription factor [Klebsiella oxytoca]|nr:response regulator transcription factor [Klebsiella oxytoca]
MKSANIFSHENNPVLVNLPGSWPGILNGNTRTVMQDDGSEFYLNSTKKNPDVNRLSNVTLICTDNYVTAGIRFCLQAISNLRFQHVNTFKTIPARIDECHREGMVIFVPRTTSEEHATFVAAVALRRRSPKVKVLVINRGGELTEQMSVAWGLSYLRANAAPNEFKSKISHMLTSCGDEGHQPQHLVTQQQWRTLGLISKGMNLSNAARTMHVSIKTVHAHKSRAMARLGVSTRLQEAWVTQAVRDVISIPKSPNPRTDEVLSI